MLAGDAYFRQDKQAPMSWKEIGQMMGTKRAPYQCLVRYHQIKHPKKERKRWQPEEDAILMSAVRKFGSKNWSQISLHLDGKTGNEGTSVSELMDAQRNSVLTGGTRP